MAGSDLSQPQRPVFLRSSILKIRKTGPGLVFSGLGPVQSRSFSGLETGPSNISKNVKHKAKFQLLRNFFGCQQKVLPAQPPKPWKYLQLHPALKRELPGRIGEFR